MRFFFFMSHSLSNPTGLMAVDASVSGNAVAQGGVYQFNPDGMKKVYTGIEAHKESTLTGPSLTLMDRIVRCLIGCFFLQQPGRYSA
jgi:hypothetical protein